MAGATENQLRAELDDLRDREPGGDGALDDVRVTWRDAEPTERPDGMTWNPDADDGGAVLAYDVWSAQRETLDAVESGDHDIVAFLAGYGSGKSVLGARWLLAQALEHPGSRFLCMGVDFQKARDTTYPKLFAQLPGDRTTLTTSSYNGPETSPLVADYNRQDHRLTLVNDSVITLGSADKYSRYAGAEFGAVWMDEPSHYGEVLHDLTGMITTRLRGVAGPKVQLWTLTGEGYNSAWEILEQRQDADGDPIGLDIEVIRASVLDNPYLTDGDKERFKRKYEGTGKEDQALHGGFAAATGLVYDEFRRDVHVKSHTDLAERVTDGWRIYGYDAGWNDPRVLLEIGRTGYGQLVVLDEFCESGTHVEDAIAWLDGKPDGALFCEHEPGDIEKFRRAGYSAKKADKSLDTGIAEVRKRLQRDGAGDLPDAPGGDGLRRKSGSTPSIKNMNGPPDGVRSARSRGSRDTDDADDDGGVTERDGWTKTGRGTYRLTGGSSDTDDGERDTSDTGGRVGLLVSARCEQTIREFLGYKEDHVGTSQATDHCLDSLRYGVRGVA